MLTRINNIWRFSLFFCMVMMFIACRNAKKETLFSQLDAKDSGIRFSNDIHENDSSNSFINEFGYMGGGVGIGDFNNDGLKDIFFSGNQVSSSLYINKGGNKFDDITAKAGVHTTSWATGVSIADVNNDGFDDIYVCVFGKNLQQRAKNLLFINQHDLTFREQASEYGLADTGYSTQAVFLDFDKDGDLDMFLTNYLLNGPNANNIYPRDRTGHSPANDKLFRNDGKALQADHPVFTDVSIEAGIKEDGYGLGVTVSDVNKDGWPDVYVANDFISNDELWLNNKNGTFTNCIDKAIQHQSYSSMGSDAADINNDGLPDIITLDMLPEHNDRKKTTFFFMNYERYQAERAMGYEPEFMRNMLQVNNGITTNGDTAVPFFSEIGQLAGVSATDWSWSVLLADFDNDGWKDIHITNGIGRDFINGDFLEFSNQVFSNYKTRGQQEDAIKSKLVKLDHVKLKNYLYLNNHNYTFTDVSDSSGVNSASMSNGSAYVDLDNDGDLDLVVNNINEAAFVLINSTNQPNKISQNHYVRIALEGDKMNTRGFGTRVMVYSNGEVQMQEENPVRGYFSSVDQQLLFGLGENKYIDSVVAIWPDNKKQVMLNIPADTLIKLSWKNSGAVYSPVLAMSGTLFSDITTVSGIVYQHHDNSFNDFAVQRLLPQKYSQLGPFIATGDIDKDGATDFFVGGGFNFAGQLFTQRDDSFVAKKLTDSIKMEEDEDCVFFDADNDGDVDLLVTSGDVQYDEASIYYKPRLYLNDGKGNFGLQADAIPAEVKTIAGCISTGDYDGDGDLDVFIGGRVSVKYPLSPRSFILQNNKGVFTDVTAKLCPALQKAGMVTGAVWADFDGDNQKDLIISGEWMPVRFFKNNRSVLQEVTGTTGLTQMNGMWRSLIAADVDKDGDIDFVAGNLGLNSNYKVSESEPMKLFASDLDGNGTIDPLMFYHIKDDDGKRRLYPSVSRSQLADQLPFIKKKFLLYSDYAHATFEDIFKGKDSIVRLSCDETRTCWLENMGKGKFVKHPLPVEAQFAPVNAIICDDLDNDGFNDLLLAGNEYQMEVVTGRYDASFGCYLKGSKKKEFETIQSASSGFIVKGDVKDMAVIRSARGEKIILIAVNNDALRVFKVSAHKN